MEELTIPANEQVIAGHVEVRLKLFKAILIFIFLSAGCHNPQGSPGVIVKKTNQHPFLVDHDRVLIAHVGGTEVDSEPLYPDTGAGAVLHYVKQGDTITLVDANGMWYGITSKGIKKQKWQWLKPLPDGEVHRIALDESKNYMDTVVPKVFLKDVYQYKDPSD